jgi:hypothetical protein
MDGAANLGATVRGLVQLGAGALVGSGVIAQEQEQQLIGAIMFLLTLAWSYWQKERQKKAVEVALNTPAPGQPVAVVVVPEPPKGASNA